MAYMMTDGEETMTSITKFLGLNQNETGETQLKLGEASYMKNFRITKDCKLEKMYGYTQVYNPNNRVRAIWFGKLGTNANASKVYVANGKVYDNGNMKGNFTDNITSIFEFGKKLYFINGEQMKVYDGETLSNEKGYVPTIKISCTPAGVGEDYEPINVITDYRKVSYSGDGTSTQYQLPETGISSVTATVNGTTTTVTAASETGIVTFSTAPAVGTDNVIIQYQKSQVPPTLSQAVLKNRYAITYGLANDTRVFLYGNPSAKNRIYYSDLGNGVPDVTYFPANNFIDIGSSNDAITNISRQYDRLIISKENESYYATYDSITDTTNNSIITFPTYPLNKAHGNIPFAQGQVLDNYVTTIDSSGIIQWTSTNVRDERNAVVISERVNEWLQSHDLAKAVTLDYQEEKEFWVGIDNEVLIYNYANNTFSLLNLPDNVRVLYVYDNEIYLGTDQKVMKFDKNVTTYNGTAIDAEWRSGFYDFEAEYRRKTMRILWLTLKPQEKTSVVVNYISDRNAGNTDKEIINETFSYTYWNYADFTYNCNAHVKPFKIKLKAKKFAFLELLLKNNRIDHKLIVDSISIKKAYGGFVK